MENINILYQEELEPAHKKLILEGLNQNARLEKDLGKNNGSFAFIIQNEKQKFLGGIQGFYYYGCFYIDLLFVINEARGKGYGSQLMQKAEELAKTRECLFMAVNTMDFEAKPFYEKHGFEIEFTRNGFEKNSEMYFFRKPIQKIS